MSLKFRYSIPAFLQVAALSLAVSPALAAGWQTGVNYGGSGPTMDLYVPSNVAASPAVVVALHYCGGYAEGAHNWFKSYADQYGFLIITPQVPNAGTSGGNGVCWEATPGRSGDLAAVVKMVDYAMTQNKADKTRVFAAGGSSGAMMTVALCASYPDVFSAGAVLAGVPAGGWNGGRTCSSVCNPSTPPAGNTAQQWGDIARKAAPSGFSGPWPRMELFHATNDQYINPANLDAEVAQWTNLWGVSNPTTEQNKPTTNWTRTSYKNSSGVVVVEANLASKSSTEKHDLTGSGLWPDVVKFFGLDKASTTAPTRDAGVGGTGGTGPARDGGTGTAGSVGAGGSQGKGGAKAETGGSTATGATGGSDKAAAGGSPNAAGAKTGTGGTTSGGKGGSQPGTSAGGKSGSGESAGSAGESKVSNSGSGGNSSSAQGGSKSGSKGGSTNSANKGGSNESAGDEADDEGSGTPSSGGGCSVAATGGGQLGALAGLMIALSGGLVRRSRRRRQ